MDPRTIPLNPVALAALKELHGEGKIMKSVPVRPENRFQGSRGWFPSALEEPKIEGYTWHCNRHTFASRLVMAEVDLRTVAELLGHRTLQLVMRYSPSRSGTPSPSVVNRPVKARNKGDTKSGTGGFAAKAMKRNKIVSN